MKIYGKPQVGHFCLKTTFIKAQIFRNKHKIVILIIALISEPGQEHGQSSVRFGQTQAGSCSGTTIKLDYKRISNHYLFLNNYFKHKKVIAIC